MKGMVYTKTGGLDVLKIQEIKKPIPKDNQVLIKVKCCSLNIIDYERFKNLYGKVPLFPRLVNFIQGSVGKPLGADISGIVEEVGKNIKHVRNGDAVFGKTCGIFPAGGWAEYALVNESQVYSMPSTLSFEEASAIPTSFETALGGIRKANVQAGQQIMIYGASGGVGLFAVQIAKVYGALVTGVCSTRNLDIARQAGCDYVVDYKKEDFRSIGKTFDAIIGINGCNPIKEYKKLLNKNGIFVGIGNGKQAMKALFLSPFSKKITTYAVPIAPQKDYLAYAKEIAEKGALKPYIDNTYCIKDIKDAIHYVVTEHTHGKVAIVMDFS